MIIHFGTPKFLPLDVMLLCSSCAQLCNIETTTDSRFGLFNVRSAGLFLKRISLSVLTHSQLHELNSVTSAISINQPNGRSRLLVRIGMSSLYIPVMPPRAVTFLSQAATEASLVLPMCSNKQWQLVSSLLTRQKQHK